jgi:hypothetical protein
MFQTVYNLAFVPDAGDVVTAAVGPVDEEEDDDDDGDGDGADFMAAT